MEKAVAFFFFFFFFNCGPCVPEVLVAMFSFGFNIFQILFFSLPFVSLIAYLLSETNMLRGVCSNIIRVV